MNYRAWFAGSRYGPGIDGTGSSRLSDRLCLVDSFRLSAQRPIRRSVILAGKFVGPEFAGTALELGYAVRPSTAIATGWAPTVVATNGSAHLNRAL